MDAQHAPPMTRLRLRRHRQRAAATAATTASLAKSAPCWPTRSTMDSPATVSAYAVDHAPAASGTGALASRSLVRAISAATWSG
jgi:hypothetical protein